MTINAKHASHIRKVKVGFIITGDTLNPNIVTERLNIAPDDSAQKGDERQNLLGQQLTPHAEGFWRIDTENNVYSKDINDHLRYLLDRLLPHRDQILQLAQKGETFFDVLWQSTYLYAGTGPIIDAENIQGIAQLQATMGFDIYQIDENEND
jgi:hypothetical protein